MPEFASIMCPECHSAAVVEMPENACLHFWNCQHCRRLIRPLPGDCCVICSYGDTVCTPRRIQET
jgi:hypothetical protein